jgi:predicted Rossmann-fold nucleotide-binding protein
MSDNAKKKTATCFGGAMNITKSPAYADSVEIGAHLAKNDYTVKTGGYRGMMEAFSKGAAEAGGHVVGCTCDSFGAHAVPNQYITEERKSKNLYERLKCLIEEEGECYRIFLCQIGGAGTLTELFICLDLFRKMKSPPSIYLIGDHYEGIIEAVKPYMNVKEHKLITIVTSTEELYQKIKEDESRHLATQGE